jgi:hypothetical protein
VAERLGEVVVALEAASTEHARRRAELERDELLRRSAADGSDEDYLRPAGPRRRRFHSQHLAGSGTFAHPLGTRPLGGYQEEGSQVRASKAAGEAAAVEIDRLQHVATLADAGPPTDVRVPGRWVRVETDTVRVVLSEAGPAAAV